MLIELVLYTLDYFLLLLLFYPDRRAGGVVWRQGAFTPAEWLAQWLFVVVKHPLPTCPSGPARLRPRGMALTDAGAGFRGQFVRPLSMTVTNILRYNDRMTEELARRNTFRYFIDTGRLSGKINWRCRRWKMSGRVPGDKQLRVRDGTLNDTDHLYGEWRQRRPQRLPDRIVCQLLRAVLVGFRHVLRRAALRPDRIPRFDAAAGRRFAHLRRFPADAGRLP